MSRSLFAVLLISLLVFTAYIGHGVAVSCPVPVTYRIGNFDERFNLSEAEILTILSEAEAVWEGATNRELFQYSPDGDYPVNFIFDDRQERTIAEEALRESLNEKELTTDNIAEQYANLVARYEELESSYESAVAKYEREVADYNTEVSRYNDQGGAPPEEFAELERAEARLEREAAELSKRSKELESLARSINLLSEQGNRLIEQYNNGVKTYNSRFGEPHEFTQGDYQGDEINIYSFSSREELLLVLVHEFGHALSLGHVEGEESIMYYLLEDQASPPTLSAEDLSAFTAVCGTDSGVAGWGTRIRHQLSEFFNHLL